MIDATSSGVAAPMIFVVEDTLIAREPLVKLLRFEGYRAMGMVNGKEAWESLPACKPDLILLDILMPVMNGLEFLGLLRTDDRWSHLPVIVLTAIRDDIWEQDIRALGVQGFVPKAGFTVDQLIGIIRDNLSSEMNAA